MAISLDETRSNARRASCRDELLALAIEETIRWLERHLQHHGRSERAAVAALACVDPRPWVGRPPFRDHRSTWEMDHCLGNEVEQLKAEARELRALTPQDRFQLFADLLAAADWLLARSPNRERQMQLLEEQEEEENRRLRDFLRRACGAR